MEQQAIKIIYIYDALCGWCYGFSPVMQQLFEKHQSTMEFEVISGGMITGDRIGPIGEVAAYIKQAYKKVEDTCGVKFGESFLQDILEEGSAEFTSIPPAIAMSIFKDYQPENAVLFASALQKAVYHDGIRPADLNAYGAYAAPFGIDADEFNAKMHEQKYADEATHDFYQTANFSVNGFPTVIAQIGEQYYLVTRGYTSLEHMENAMQRIMSEATL